MIPITSDDSIVKIKSTGEIVSVLNGTLNSSTLENPKELCFMENGSIYSINDYTRELTRLNSTGGLEWNSSLNGDFNLINISWYGILPNGIFVIYDRKANRIFEIDLLGNIIQNSSCIQTYSDLEITLHNSPLLLINNTNKLIIENRDFNLSLMNRIFNTSIGYFWRLYYETNDSWISGPNYQFHPSSSSISFNLEDGNYLLEMINSENHSIVASPIGSDLYLFYNNSNKIQHSFQLVVDTHTNFALNAPILIQGLLELNNFKGAILSWSPLSNAENYILYYSETKEIVEINEDIVIINNTTKTYYYIDDLSKYKGYFVVVGVNRFQVSEISNNLQLNVTNIPDYTWLIYILTISSIIATGFVLYAFIRKKMMQRMKKRRKSKH
jgi:hypothetical protein